MKDIINNVVEEYWKKGKSVDAIRKYIKKKYRINIEKKALLKRLEFLNLPHSA